MAPAYLLTGGGVSSIIVCSPTSSCTVRSGSLPSLDRRGSFEGEPAGGVAAVVVICGTDMAERQVDGRESDACWLREYARSGGDDKVCPRFFRSCYLRSVSG